MVVTPNGCVEVRQGRDDNHTPISLATNRFLTRVAVDAEALRHAQGSSLEIGLPPRPSLRRPS